MKNYHLILLFFTACLLSNCESPNTSLTNKEDSRTYYQLKIYSFDSDLQESVVDNYLEKAFLPGLKQHGVNQIGVFKQGPKNSDSIKRTYVLIPFESLEQFHGMEEKLETDESYLSAGDEYLNAPHNQTPYHRVESILIYAFEDFPDLRPTPLEGKRAQRIYELRSYESPTETYFKNKVDMFNAGGEIKLFDKLGFNAVFYGEVISGPKMPNLMYMTTFSNQESRDKHWKAFLDSPEWKELGSMDKYKNNVSHIDISFLYPTAYSDY